MSVIFERRALRGDPSGLRAAVNDIASAQAEGDAYAIQMAGLLDGYQGQHKGPDIDAIVDTGRAVVATMTTLMSDYAIVEAALRRGVMRLTGLEVESQMLWNEAQALDAQTVIGEPNWLEVARLERWFFTIQADEDDVYRDVAAEIDGAAGCCSPVG